MFVLPAAQAEKFAAAGAAGFARGMNRTPMNDEVVWQAVRGMAHEEFRAVERAWDAGFDRARAAAGV